MKIIGYDIGSSSIKSILIDVEYGEEVLLWIHNQSNDATAGGVAAALMSENEAGKVAVSGQDAELTACQRIVEGTQTVINNGRQPMDKVYANVPESQWPKN